MPPKPCTTIPPQLRLTPPRSRPSRALLRPDPQVKLRPTGELSLRDVHAAAAKLQRCTSADGVDGAEAALAVHSVASVLARDEAKGASRTIALVTDRLYPADDFATFLDVRCIWALVGLVYMLPAQASCG